MPACGMHVGTKKCTEPYYNTRSDVHATRFEKKEKSKRKKKKNSQFSLNL
jgi:hypothetical protein